MKKMALDSKYSIILILAWVLAGSVSAQPEITAFIDAGEHNASGGFYLKPSLLGAYPFGKMRIEGAFQFGGIPSGTNLFSGTELQFRREFRVKDFQFEARALFMHHFFSDLLHEANWGVIFQHQREHFTVELGTGFRSYKITQRAVEQYEIESNQRIRENWNLIYLLQYNLKPPEHHWNVGGAVTNMDHFLINQETNPMFRIHGRCLLSGPFIIFAESWYKSAGILNISANYFGFFIRTGLIWTPSLKK